MTYTYHHHDCDVEGCLDAAALRRITPADRWTEMRRELETELETANRVTQLNRALESVRANLVSARTYRNVTYRANARLREEKEELQVRLAQSRSQVANLRDAMSAQAHIGRNRMGGMHHSYDPTGQNDWGPIDPNACPFCHTLNRTD